MTIRVQTLRSSTTGAVPAAGTRSPGELWTNFPDLQIGVIDAAKNPQKLVGVRYFSTTANYVSGDFVIQAGKLYVATTNVTAGAFNSGQWSQIAALSDIPPLYVLPTASTTVLGGVKVDGSTIVIVGGVISGVLPVASTTVLGGVKIDGTSITIANGVISSVLPVASTTVLGGVKIDGTSITIANGVISGASQIAVQSTAPASPADNSLWWESDTGMLFLRYNDGNSSQWVQINALPNGAGYLSLLGGTMAGVANLVGVINGSDAAPGQVGEVISANVTANVTLPLNTVTAITSISLTPGDWDVTGEVWFTPNTTAVTGIYAAINTTVAFPAVSSISTARTTLLTSPGIPTGAMNSLALRACRMSVSAPTTTYLLGQINSVAGVGTGNIMARRVR